jgi:maltose/moltooligosaccharide transporter
MPTGFLSQSFFTGLGITLANLSLYAFQKIDFLKQSHGQIPYWVFASFFLGSICSITSVLWSTSTTPEIPPTEEELAALRAEKGGLFAPFIEIFSAIQHMPRVMWQLALVYLFQWYALFCYWQNTSKSIALSVWNATPQSNPKQYEEAVGWAGLVGGWSNIMTFLSAFILVYLAKKYSAKAVHVICLLLAGIGFIIFPMIQDKHLIFLPVTGFGIAWASMMGVPYLMVVHNIPKERYGVYMGIINMMIVIPMILQTTTFGYVLQHFLNNDPRKAISFAGILLLIASLATLRIKASNPSDEELENLPSAGGHG